MPHRGATGLILLIAALTAAPANAVVLGAASSLGGYTVRLVGNGYCSGVVVARRIVATAAHCAHGMRVVVGGGSMRVVGVSRGAQLDDGRRVNISGDGAFLHLAEPLPYGSPVPVGPGSGDTFTIAGYGTTDEGARGAFGSLDEATLVPATARALVDPHRSGSIGASACFGDSGRPVLRGGELVGVITRAAHPSPRIACGDLTRWAAISVSGTATEVVVARLEREQAPAEPHAHRHHRHARYMRHLRHATESHTASASLLRDWSAPKIEKKRRTPRHKTVKR